MQCVFRRYFEQVAYFFIVARSLFCFRSLSHLSTHQPLPPTSQLCDQIKPPIGHLQNSNVPRLNCTSSTASAPSSIDSANLSGGGGCNAVSSAAPAVLLQNKPSTRRYSLKPITFIMSLTPPDRSAMTDLQFNTDPRLKKFEAQDGQLRSPIVYTSGSLLKESPVDIPLCAVGTDCVEKNCVEGVSQNSRDDLLPSHSKRLDESTTDESHCSMINIPKIYDLMLSRSQQGGLVTDYEVGDQLGGPAHQNLLSCADHITPTEQPLQTRITVPSVNQINTSELEHPIQSCSSLSSWSQVPPCNTERQIPSCSTASAKPVQARHVMLPSLLLIQRRPSDNPLSVKRSNSSLQ